MAKMRCPSCGAEAKSAAGKPYCASCGWNVAEAKRVVRKRGIVYAILIAVLAAIFTWGFILAQQTTMAGYVVGFIVLCMSPIMFLIWVWPWMRLRKVEQRLGMAGGAGGGAGGTGGGAGAEGGRGGGEERESGR